MKIINTKFIIAGILITNAFVSCKKQVAHTLGTHKADIITNQSDDNASNELMSKLAAATTIDSSVFYNGAFTVLKIPAANLQKLGGAIAGVPLVVSNNPEKINTLGWLFKNPALLGTNSKMPLTGKFNLYLYHHNNTGAPLYIHVIASNPNSTSITLSGKGVIYTSSNYSGNAGKGYGPSYKIAENWLNATYTHSFVGKNIPAYLAGSPTPNYTSIATVLLNSAKTIDGRFEFDALSAGNVPANSYIYVIASASATVGTAFNLAQTNIQATGNFLQETPTTFGRECGIYDGSEWKGLTTLNLPNRKGYVGISLNTAQKNNILQNQNAPALGVINNSSSFTYGNYGMGYFVDLRFVNVKNTARTLKVYLVHSATNPAKLGMTWHAPMKIDSNPLLETYTTLNNNKQLLSTITLNAATAGPSSKVQKIKFYVPGLISTNMQLVVETN